MLNEKLIRTQLYLVAPNGMFTEAALATIIAEAERYAQEPRGQKNVSGIAEARTVLVALLAEIRGTACGPKE